MTIVLAILLGLALLALALRIWFTRTGSGRLAQVEFRRRSGARVAQLLDGEVDPRPNSPWIAVQVDGRPARMVAARVDGRMQAGVELFERAIPVNVYLTSGDPDELELAPGVDQGAVLDVVEQLRAAEVDSCASTMPIARLDGAPHVLRMRFDSVDELPARFHRVAPLLRELEQLGEHRVSERD